jgi:hypothetical protein
VLNRDGTLYRIDGAGKLGQQVITRRIDDPTVMLLNERGYHFPISFEGVNRGLFIVAHEATVAFDIGAEDSGEFTFHTAAFPAPIILLTGGVCQTVREENLGFGDRGGQIKRQAEDRG